MTTAQNTAAPEEGGNMAIESDRKRLTQQNNTKEQSKWSHDEELQKQNKKLTINARRTRKTSNAQMQ